MALFFLLGKLLNLEYLNGFVGVSRIFILGGLVFYEIKIRGGFRAETVFAELEFLPEHKSQNVNE